MEVEFEDDDLERLYTEPDFRIPRMGPDLINQFRRKVGIVSAATDERDLRAMRSLRFEKLDGDRLGQSSIRLNDQWRLILHFYTRDDGRIAVVVEVVDYH